MSSLLFVSSGNSSALDLRQWFPFSFAFNLLHDFHFASICFMTFDCREYSSLRCCALTLAIFLINNANEKKKSWNLMLTSSKKFKTKLELLTIGNCHGFVTVITKRWYSFSGFPFKRFFLDKWIKSILITPDCQCQNRKQGLLNFSSSCLKVVTTISIVLCIVTRSHRNVINTDQEMSLTGAQTAIDGNKQVVTISLVDVRVTLLPLSSVETGTKVFFSL